MLVGLCLRSVASCPWLGVMGGRFCRLVPVLGFLAGLLVGLHRGACCVVCWSLQLVLGQLLLADLIVVAEVHSPCAPAWGNRGALSIWGLPAPEQS